MKLCAVLLTLFFAGCAYNGPKLQLQVGFMGTNVGVTIGADPQSKPLSLLSK